MTRNSALLVLAMCAALGACQKEENPVRTSNPADGTTTSSSVAQSSVPGARPDRDSAPAPTPSTHAGDPQPESTAAPSARDTPASKPSGDLTPAEESKSMPKPGQTDNHFTPSIDGEVKGTQQSPGTPNPSEGAPSVGSTQAPKDAPASPK